MKDMFVTNILEFVGYYGNTQVDFDVNAKYSEGYELISTTMTHEPLNDSYKVLLIYKLRPMAAAIHGD